MRGCWVRTQARTVVTFQALADLTLGRLSEKTAVARIMPARKAKVSCTRLLLQACLNLNRHSGLRKGLQLLRATSFVAFRVCASPTHEHTLAWFRMSNLLAAVMLKMHMLNSGDHLLMLLQVKTPVLHATFTNL